MPSRQTSRQVNKWPGANGIGPADLLAVGTVSGAVIALQIAIIRTFAVTTWAHFGSLVIAIALFGFGIVSVAMIVARPWFEGRQRAWAAGALLTFGPLLALANTAAQAVAFNPLFLLADPDEVWRLLATSLLYFLPFLPGALFIGLVFLRGRARFGTVYFANMTGSGLGGLVVLLTQYLVPPDALLLVPLTLWLVGSAAWFRADRGGRTRLALGGAAVLAFGIVLALPQINVSPFKGVSYARNFPDSERLYESAGPLGHLEVYRSSYFHFAPGLSDMAAVAGTALPRNAYLGLYIDGDGPIGLMEWLPDEAVEYFGFLPMTQAFLLAPAPRVFVVQFGGGISTQVALRSGASAVTVAEGNPMVLRAIRDDPELAALTGDILRDPRVTVLPYAGRLHAPHAQARYDIVDLSLADSTGLSGPGAFSIEERYTYTVEAMRAYMAALDDGGILSVTMWNREDPPKAVLRLFATMVEAARAIDGDAVADRFFVNHTYLSTVTVLYKRGGFRPDEVDRLLAHSRDMAFEVLHAPGQTLGHGDPSAVLGGFRDLAVALPPAVSGGPEVDLSATNLYRVGLERMLAGDLAAVADAYVFDVFPLTNDRPYFAGYVKARDLPAFARMPEAVADDWGYLLLWAALLQSLAFGLVLLLLPLVFGWRTIFSPQPGKAGTVIYFLALGLGYILVEVALIAKFVLALASPSVSASVLITGMLVFSGLGSLLSGRLVARAGRVMPWFFVAIAAVLTLYALALDPLLDRIAVLPYGLRMGACLAVLFPPAFLMGFPFATGMTVLSRQGKTHFFLWAWGINGSFSVVAAVLAPILAVQFGIAAALLVAGGCYLACWPGLAAILRAAPAAT